jgi:RHS repeat-associated protein
MAPSMKRAVLLALLALLPGLVYAQGLSLPAPAALPAALPTARAEALPLTGDSLASKPNVHSFGPLLDLLYVSKRFTGKERDFETGRDYFGARYFSGAQGRFTSADDIYNDLDIADPQKWNRYAYVQNRPLTYSDPDGTSATLVGGGVGLLVAGGIELGSQLLRSEGNVNWRDVGAAALGGATTGAMLGLVVDTGGAAALGVGSWMAAGGTAAVVGGGVEAAAAGRPYTLDEAATRAAGGMATGPLGGIKGPTVLGTLERSSAAGPDLSSLAAQIREGGLHAAARNTRTFAVGVDSEGRLFAASSNGFDRGQREAAARLGITVVRSSTGAHAEENLLRRVPGLKDVGTSVRTPCGANEQNCIEQLATSGVGVSR